VIYTTDNKKIDGKLKLIPVIFSNDLNYLV